MPPLSTSYHRWIFSHFKLLSFVPFPSFVSSILLRLFLLLLSIIFPVLLLSFIFLLFLPFWLSLTKELAWPFYPTPQPHHSHTTFSPAHSIGSPTLLSWGGRGTLETSVTYSHQRETTCRTDFSGFLFLRLPPVLLTSAVSLLDRRVGCHISWRGVGFQKLGWQSSYKGWMSRRCCCLLAVTAIMRVLLLLAQKPILFFSAFIGGKLASVVAVSLRRDILVPYILFLLYPRFCSLLRLLKKAFHCLYFVFTAAYVFSCFFISMIG